MKLSDFDIDFIKFQNEEHAFSYHISDTFFTLKEGSLYSSCDVHVKLDCKKTESTIIMDYILSGSVNTVCERCLESIAIGIDIGYQQILKITGDKDLLTQENYLSVNHQIVSVYDTIYEQICTALPYRKICDNALNNRVCNIDYSVINKDEISDPRWEELKKIKLKYK